MTNEVLKFLTGRTIQEITLLNDGSLIIALSAQPAEAPAAEPSAESVVANPPPALPVDPPAPEVDATAEAPGAAGSAGGGDDAGGEEAAPAA